MNLWITLFLPIILIDLILQAIKYFSYSSDANKDLTLILITGIHIILSLVFLTLINNFAFEVLAILLVSTIIVLNYLQYILVTNYHSFRVSKFMASFLTFLLFGCVWMSLFWFYGMV